MNAQPLQPAFRALADPTRRDILRLLGQSEMTVAQVADRFDITRAAVKKHLIVLEDGDLITSRRAGRETFNRLNADALRPVFDWIGWFDRFWDDHLSRLQDVFDETPAKKDSHDDNDNDKNRHNNPQNRPARR